METWSVAALQAIDVEALAASPLARRLALVRGDERHVFVDGVRAGADTAVELTLDLEDDSTTGAGREGGAPVSAAAEPAHCASSVPRLGMARAFDLFMPEHTPPRHADIDALARAWFRGAAATHAGGVSLQMACDLLPDTAVAERQVLQQAVQRARTPHRPAATVAPTTAHVGGPLHAPGWHERDPHALLDACLATLRRSKGERFEERPGQTQMAHAVLDSLASDQALVVEAGTGTGKTLAYVLPAVLVALRDDRRFVVSTHTRHLQQQLVGRDLPWLWSRLGLDTVRRGPERAGLTWARLLGRGNYVCRQALQEWLAAQRRKGGSILAAQILLALLRSPDGTLEDLLPDMPPEVWAQIQSRRGMCVGKVCRGASPCPVHRVREEARSADVVVVNHALLLADASRGGGILGDWAGLVVDEAHHLQTVATEALGRRLGPASIEAWSRPLGRLQREADAVSSLAPKQCWSRRIHDWCTGQHRLQRMLAQWWQRLDASLPQRARVPARQRYQDGAEVFGGLVVETRELEQEIAVQTRAGLQAVSSLQDVVIDEPALAELFDLLAACVELLEEVATAFAFLVRGDDEESVFFLDFSAADAALHEIVALPLDVSTELPDLLHLGDAGTVFTSATLCVEGDSGWFRRQIGIEPGARTLQVESPFDHEAQCLLVQTAQLGTWRDPDFAPQVADLVAALQQRTRRRTLVLLTSRRALAELEGELRRLLPAHVEVLAQGPSVSRSRLASRFAATPGAVLLGLASFWEGVDFPGRALELLVIPKLPFLVPNEPLVEARCQRLRARGEDPFTDFILPEAVLRLRQGFGRLLRTPADRGAVVLLDARLETRAYGAEFLRPLPIPSRTYEDADSLVDAVASWCGAAGETAAGWNRGMDPRYSGGVDHDDVAQPGAP